MLRICLTHIFLLLQIYLSAQDKAEFYIKETIPDSLTKGADAVCRLDETEVEIKSPGKIIVRERHMYTILNDKAEDLAEYVTSYDKLSTINYVNGTLYNANGKEVRHFKKKDMSDYANEDAAFVSDERLKSNKFTYNQFPFTVDFEEEDEMSGAYYIPEWNPIRTNKVSLEVSRYILTTPSDYKFRYKLINANILPVIAQKKDKITYTWEIRNLTVIPDEPFAISSEYYNPYMLVGPTDFELEGYKGNISTWQDYGKFYYSLYQGRDILPVELKIQVHKLTDNIQDPYKKIALLYDYLQKNTHYVLIMFGIGGMQPYDASYVARNKYGDCKALSNFMVALLKEAGIAAYPVAIWGGREKREFVPDFPSHQSNHIICAVPIEKDTVWLECTSQFLPPGYLGSFTDNRYGLLVDKNGGKLVHTPAYLKEDNISIRKVSAVLDQEGNLRVKSETSFKALSGDRVDALIHYYSKEQQLDYLKKTLNLPTYTVNAVNYTEDNTFRIPLYQESLELSVSDYGHETGKRIFINPNILRQSVTKVPNEKERKLDFQFNNEYQQLDSVEIKFPTGYTIESKPKDLSLETPYGRYKTRLLVTEDKIMYYRYLDQYSGRFPASAYIDIRSYFNQIYEADHAQVVLVKKN